MNHLTRSLEDYLKASYIFELESGVSRSSQIAQFLGVKLPAVNKAIKELKKRGLISHRRYGYIALTDKGRKIAEKIFLTHKALFELLTLFGVGRKLSEEYACYIEHISDEEKIKEIIYDIVLYFKKNRKEREKLLRFMKRRKNERDNAFEGANEKA